MTGGCVAVTRCSSMSAPPFACHASDLHVHLSDLSYLKFQRRIDWRLACRVCIETTSGRGTRSSKTTRLHKFL
jgi:hypothetical protein